MTDLLSVPAIFGPLMAAGKEIDEIKVELGSLKASEVAALFEEAARQAKEELQGRGE